MSRNNLVITESRMCDFRKTLDEIVQIGKSGGLDMDNTKVERSPRDQTPFKAEKLNFHSLEKQFAANR
jgi:hypothetical protein